MKIKLYAPPIFDHTYIDDQGFLEVPRKSRLRDILNLIGVPHIIRPILFAKVNYENVSGSFVLQEGDVVSIFWPISTG